MSPPGSQSCWSDFWFSLPATSFADYRRKRTVKARRPKPTLPWRINALADQETMRAASLACRARQFRFALCLRGPEGLPSWDALQQWQYQLDPFVDGNGTQPLLPLLSRFFFMGAVRLTQETPTRGWATGFLRCTGCGAGHNRATSRLDGGRYR